MYETELHFAYNDKLKYKTIYMKLYKKERIIELHSEKGVPIEYFVRIKKHIKEKFGDSIELRVV